MSRRKKGDKVDGWVMLDKPVGLGSTPAVSRVRRLFGAAEGRPRRHARSAGQRRAADRPGRGDQDRALRHGRPEGIPLHALLRRKRARPRTPRARSPPPATCAPTDAAIRSALAAFVGEIEQVPPAFSALKIDGQARLRPGARRRGGRSEAPAHRRSNAWSCWADRTRIMQISWFPAARAPTSGRWAAIWRAALGTVGHLSALRRTAVGPFREEAAISLPKLEALGHIPALLGALAPVATALDDIPALALTEAQADRLRQGQPVLLTRDAPPSGALSTRRDRQQAGGAGPFGRRLSQAGACVQPLSNGDPDVDYSRAQGGADQVVCPGQ